MTMIKIKRGKRFLASHSEIFWEDCGLKLHGIIYPGLEDSFMEVTEINVEEFFNEDFWTADQLGEFLKLGLKKHKEMICEREIK